MRPIKVITDSCCDLPSQYRGKFDLPYLSFNLFFNDREMPTEIDISEQDRKELYDVMRRKKRIFILPATEYSIETKFERYISAGFDILYVACSEEQNPTVLKAESVAKRLREKHPDARIEVYDSHQVSFGEGLMAIKACEYVQAGKSMDKTIELLNEARKHVIEFLTVDSVSYLAKAHRIKAYDALIYHIADSKPIIISDAEGKQATIMRVRTLKNAVDKIIDLFVENVEHPENQHIFIGHGNEPELGEYVKNKLIEKGVQPLRFHVECVGPEVGASTGPGTIAIFGFGKEVTFVGK